MWSKMQIAFHTFNYVVINDFVICEISVLRLPKEDLCLHK